MIERTETVRTDDGAMPTILIHPEQGGPFPAVVIFQDFWGIREELIDIARKIAVCGYCVLLPDLFYRSGTHKVDFRNDKGQTLSAWLLTPEQMAQAGKAFGQFTDANAMRDTAALLGFAGTQPMIAAGGVGTVGYCFGGRLAVRAMASFPGTFVAAGIFHGTAVADGTPTSAHLGLPAIEGEIYFGYPETDDHAPPESIALIGRTLADAGIRHHIEIHAGALHGYSMPQRDIFDKRAYNRDWEMTFAMFHRQIPPGFAR